RLEGAGQLVGRAADASIFDEALVQNGLRAAGALFELGAAAVVLGLGAGGALHALALFVCIAAALLLLGDLAGRERRWLETRIAVSRELVESMAGHRTRVAQLAPDRWHAGEARALDELVARRQRTDRRAALLLAMPRAWLLIGLAGLATGLVA